MDPTPLEDGSTAYYDGSGNLTQIVSRDGSVYQADTSILSDFGRSVAGAFGDAIRTAFARPAATAAAPAQAASSSAAATQRTMVTIGALIVGAIVLKKVFA